MQKSRINTEQRILDAVETLLLTKGFPSVGINAISREAGCDKVLIYRYFGGLDGLLERFAQDKDLWWTIDEIIVENMDEISQFSLPQFLDLLLIQISNRQKNGRMKFKLRWRLVRCLRVQAHIHQIVALKQQLQLSAVVTGGVADSACH